MKEENLCMRSRGVTCEEKRCFKSYFEAKSPNFLNVKSDKTGDATQTVFMSLVTLESEVTALSPFI